MNWLHNLSGAVVVSMAMAVYGASPDDQFVDAYNLIQEADALVEVGKTKEAREKYLEAQEGLAGLKQSHPDWNEKVVQFRLKYVAEKLKPLTSGEKTAEPLIQDSRKLESISNDSDTSRELKALREQTSRLAADRELLQAKLKEAWSAQPAAIDPRELAEAEGRNKSLQKEVALLKVQLEKAEAKPDKPIDPAVFEETRTALAAAQQKLDQQSEVVAALTLERDTLQNHLKTYLDGSRVKTLHEENEALRRQAGDPAVGNAMEGLRQQVDLLQDALRLAREENQSLEQQRDTARNRLKELTEELDQSKASGQGTNAERLANELALLRARLAAMEREQALVAPEKSTDHGSARVKPAFADQRPDGAERADEPPFRTTDQGVRPFAEPGNTQLDQKRLSAMEASLRSALDSNPNDASALSQFGILKARQREFDEALEALSRAAQLDSTNAATFQYLGLTLGEKGLRGPAESALRRAVELAPGNADAHYNLALLYATQNPPLRELARRHYQKAVEAGHPKNPELEKALPGAGAAAATR